MGSSEGGPSFECLEVEVSYLPLWLLLTFTSENVCPKEICGGCVLSSISVEYTVYLYVGPSQTPVMI